MSVPISDTLSRILEHDPDYRPPRHRAPAKVRPPLRNPGVFTLKAIADALETTVGDLLGEPGHVAVRDAVSLADRRKVRDAVVVLRALLDLDDESLGAPPPRRPSGELDREEFAVLDYDYPEPLLFGIAASGTAEPRLAAARVTGDSMEPELPKGSHIAIDLDRTTPSKDDLVAVYVEGEGGMLGRWRLEDGRPSLARSNPAFEPFPLTDERPWIVIGTVTACIRDSKRSLFK